MIYKQMMTAFDEMGVKPIETVGKEFDPNLHNAVMHVEDDSARREHCCGRIPEGIYLQGFRCKTQHGQSC